MKTFEIITKYSDDKNCFFSIQGNRLQIYNTDGEPIMTANVPDSSIPFPKQIAVKNYSENEGLEEVLLNLGILGEKVGELPLMYVTVNIYQMNEDILREYM